MPANGVVSIPKIVAFSYKGGSGRSTAAYNIAGSLFRKGKKVVCLDMDFGAPGMHEILVARTLGSFSAAAEKQKGGVRFPSIHDRLTELRRNKTFGIQHFFQEHASFEPGVFTAQHCIDYKELCTPLWADNEYRTLGFEGGRKDPKARSIAAARSSVGTPLPPGVRTSQNREWL